MSRDIIGTCKSKVSILSLTTNNNTFINVIEIANHFNKYFLSVADELHDKIKVDGFQVYTFLDKITPCNQPMFLTPLDDHEVERVIRSLKNSNSLGPDNMSLKVLNVLASVISKMSIF